MYRVRNHLHTKCHEPFPSFNYLYIYKNWSFKGIIIIFTGINEITYSWFAQAKSKRHRFDQVDRVNSRENYYYIMKWETLKFSMSKRS